ncbi:MAG: CU044_2847 family protein [Syntrophobacter sp.]
MPLKLTKLVAPDGSEIFLQYDGEVENYRLRATGAVDDVMERSRAFKDHLETTVRAYSSMVLDAIKSSTAGASSPEKVILEFGIQVGGQAGIPLITSGTAQANVKVSIQWNLGGKPS